MTRRRLTARDAATLHQAVAVLSRIAALFAEWARQLALALAGLTEQLRRRRVAARPTADERWPS